MFTIACILAQQIVARRLRTLRPLRSAERSVFEVRWAAIAASFAFSCYGGAFHPFYEVFSGFGGKSHVSGFCFLDFDSCGMEVRRRPFPLSVYQGKPLVVVFWYCLVFAERCFVDFALLFHLFD